MLRQRKSIVVRRTLLAVLLAVFATPSLAAEAWDLFDFPELLINSYDVRDLPDGPVARHTAGGIDPKDAVQPDSSFRPVKLSDGDGVRFAPGSGAHLDFADIRDALGSYRWSLVTFRISANTDDAETALITVNLPAEVGNVAGTQTPALIFRPVDGTLIARWRGLTDAGSTDFDVISAAVVADGETWNVALAYRRHGRIFLNVNGYEGRPSGPETFTFSNVRSISSRLSRIGSAEPSGIDWSYQTIAFGQSDLSEALVDKIVAWAMWRVGRGPQLPPDSRYSMAPPLVDTADRPKRYVFDAESWKKTWAKTSKRSRQRKKGDPLPQASAYVPVFLDDFRRNSVGLSYASAGGERHIWYGPGWNESVGKLARMQPPGATPDLYRHDPEAQHLTLSLAYDDGWRAPALYSVNDAGVGRSWAGGGIFRARVKFPAIEGNPKVGYFPAIPWFYNVEHLIWRSGERIEFDGFEFEGIDPRWINGGSSHVHKGYYPGHFGRLSEDAPNHKIFGKRAWVDVWDGEFHLWEVRIEPEETSLAVDGKILATAPTPREYLERLYMVIDYALKPDQGEPDRTTSHDMVIDYVEVLQRREIVDAVPALFLRRPEISGSARVGAALTCHAHLPDAVRDIRFHWIGADGYPKAVSTAPEYVVSEADLGDKLRCRVRAVGATDMPEAYSAETDQIVSGKRAKMDTYSDKSAAR
ncbi:hypothetical protein [Tropicimonas marinistellae]|uniref:hypothetical protein n=1 Tax=Tropicimonas marinistellae TaxID=1739787 RepID=UPI00082BFAD3|nr:hypothetical protein [Tropicimonas marinistellae]